MTQDGTATSGNGPSRYGLGAGVRIDTEALTRRGRGRGNSSNISVAVRMLLVWDYLDLSKGVCWGVDGTRSIGKGTI